jgi:hypothetical protein
MAANEGGAVPGNVCSGTELVAFTKDPTGVCLDCLLNQGGCLNNANQGNSGKECEDPFTGVNAGTTTAECLAVMNCDFGLTPVNAPPPGKAGPLATYCGVGVTQANCALISPATAATGLCSAQIVAGFPAGSSAGTISGNIAVPASAAGRAGSVVGCGNIGCASCFN